MLGDQSNRLPEIKTGLYRGAFTAGQSKTLDVDDVQVFPTGGAPPEPTPIPPTPEVPPCQ
jgi:hypothetical protein